MPRFIKLSDGRKLAFEEYGDPKGKPVFYFHGWPASRLSGAVLDRPAKKLKLRIIATDRPGYGLSDPKQRRKLLDWPTDILELANHLKIDKFSIIGSSGGAPYAYVCAYSIPKRITYVGIVAGLGPVLVGKLKAAGWAAKNIPWLWQGLVWMELYLTTKFFNGRIFEFGARTLLMSPSDKTAMRKNKGALRKTTLEAFRQGARKVTSEWAIYSNPWGFSLEEINIPIHLWHGTKDKNIPFVVAETNKKLLRKGRLTAFKEGGHYLMYEHREEILKELIG